MAEVAKTSFAMSAILGISQTGARPKSGMAVLEGLVAALEVGSVTTARHRHS